MLLRPLLWFSLALGVWAQQTITTTNEQGATIIIAVTTDINGVVSTQTLQTLEPTPQAPAAPTPEEHGGPVGQPGATPTAAGQPTPFTYTTTDAQGQFTAVLGTFTPIFTTPPRWVPPGTGTVLGYDDWLKLVGTNTINPNGARALAPSLLLVGLGVMLGVWMG